MKGEEYINANEAATTLGVTPGWVASLCRTQVLEAQGGGRGRAWEIKKASVERLAQNRAQPVAPEVLEDLAREIESDREAQESASRQAEDSFRDRVLSIAKRYGFGVLLTVAGVAVGAVPVVNVLAPVLIAEGIREIVRAGKRQTK